VSETRALSARQLEVASLVAEGYRDREIAERLGIAESTVSVHLQDAYAKAGVRNRTALAVWWTQHRPEPAEEPA
jgi:two-component system, NarL family, nitrate/nitrite response regulator NarL